MSLAGTTRREVYHQRGGLIIDWQERRNSQRLEAGGGIVGGLRRLIAIEVSRWLLRTKRVVDFFGCTPSCGGSGCCHIKEGFILGSRRSKHIEISTPSAPPATLTHQEQKTTMPQELLGISPTKSSTSKAGLTSRTSNGRSSNRCKVGVFFLNRRILRTKSPSGLGRLGRQRYVRFVQRGIVEAFCRGDLLDALQRLIPGELVAILVGEVEIAVCRISLNANDEGLLDLHHRPSKHRPVQAIESGVPQRLPPVDGPRMHVDHHVVEVLVRELRLVDCLQLEFAQSRPFRIILPELLLNFVSVLDVIARPVLPPRSNSLIERLVLLGRRIAGFADSVINQSLELLVRNVNVPDEVLAGDCDQLVEDLGAFLRKDLLKFGCVILPLALDDAMSLVNDFVDNILQVHLVGIGRRLYVCC